MFKVLLILLKSKLDFKPFYNFITDLSGVFFGLLETVWTNRIS